MITRRGTTVLELVVALVVTSAVATIGAGAFSQLVDRRTAIVDATRETERAAALRALLRSWLTVGVVELPAVTQRVQASTTGAAESSPDSPDALFFTTTALSPAPAPNLRLRLYVDGDPSTPQQGLTLEYRPAPGADWQRHELDASIASMSVEYLSKMTGEWMNADEAVRDEPVAMRVHFGAPGRDRARLWDLPITFPLMPVTSSAGGTP